MPSIDQAAAVHLLIDTCRDAEHGFREAAQLVSDRPLRSLFLDLAKRRAALVAELLPHAASGEPAANGTAGAAVHRRWMEARSQWSGHDDRTVLEEARRGDTVTLSAFKHALEGPLSPAVRALVARHYADAVDTHDDLQQALIEAM